MSERLQRALARAGFGSRRACEELIAEGRVRVNGAVATLGDSVDVERDRVEVDGHVANLDPNIRSYALHKPAGVVTTMRDPQGRADISRYLPSEGPRVFPVGRLDRATEGLLILTNDGDLANHLMHPRFGVEKEYLAEVEGSPTRAQLARLRKGIDLEDGPARAASVRVVAAHAARGGDAAHAARGGGTGRPGARAALRLVMTEGRKREVRRLLGAVGLPVVRLVRLRVGPVRLGGLAPGAYRELTREELVALAQALGR